MHNLKTIYREGWFCLTFKQNQENNDTLAMVNIYIFERQFHDNPIDQHKAIITSAL